MEKISSVDVLRDTVALVKKRYGLLIGISALFFVISILLPVWTTRAANCSVVMVSLLVLYLIGMAAYVILYNNLIGTIRGETPGYGVAKFFAKYIKMIGKILLLILTTAVPVALILVALIALGGILRAAIGAGSIPPAFLGGGVVFLTLFGWTLLAMRWWPIIPAAVLDEESSLRSSWRMTRGYTWRLGFFMLPYLISTLTEQFILDEQLRQGFSALFSPGMAAFAVVYLVVYGFTFAALTVWYVRLKERYEAGENFLLEAADDDGITVKPDAGSSPGNSGNNPYNGRSFMSGKITAWGIFKESAALMWRNKLAVLGFLVVETVLVAAYAVLGMDDKDMVKQNLDAVSLGPFVIGGLLLALVAMFTYMFYIHYMVTAWRGAPELVPQGFLGRFLRMVWTSIKICLTSMLLMLLAAIPFVAVAVAAPGLKDNLPVLILAAVLGLGVFLFLFIVSIRLNLAIPGVVAGERTTLREAWRMSRGHGGRIFLSMLLLMLVGFAFGLVVAAPVILVSGFPPTTTASLPIYACQGLCGLLGATFLCVWYVRLCAGPEPAAPEAPKVEGLAEKVSEGYYGR